MLRAILIDDEKNALEVLKIQLQQYCTGIEVIDCCAAAEEGIAAIVAQRPDVVFLDIEMPYKNGFDVLKETAAINYEVIFTTAYDQFAIKAFKHSAIDYLLKPIDIRELQEAVDRLLRRKSNNGKLEEKLNILLQQVQTPVEKKERIGLPVKDGVQLFDLAEIIRCESESNYTHIFLTNNRKILVAKTLKDVEEVIGSPSFIRVHQSHLVNSRHIVKVWKGDTGHISMSDGSAIMVSRNYRQAFMHSFKKL